LLRSTVLARTGRQINNKLALEASVGAEANQTESDGSDNTDGLVESDIPSNTVIWDLGLRWQPGPRTGLTASIGQRSFGERPSLQLHHERRRVALRVAWAREYTRTDPELLATDTLADLSTLENPGNTTLTDGTVAEFSDLLVLDNRLQASFSLRGRVTTLMFSGVYSEREALQSGQLSSRARLLDVTLERQLSSGLTASLSLSRAVESDLSTAIARSTQVTENRVALWLRYSP